MSEISFNITDNDLTTSIEENNGLSFGIANSGAVDSVNGKTGVVVLNATDVGALPNSTVIPTKTSDLTNDSGFLTEHQSLSGYATEQWVGQQGYLTQHQSIKTVNGNTMVGSGDLPIKEAFMVEYGVTPFADIVSAYEDGKFIYIKYVPNPAKIPVYYGHLYGTTTSKSRFLFEVEYNGNGTWSLPSWSDNLIIVKEVQGQTDYSVVQSTYCKNMYFDGTGVTYSWDSTYNRWRFYLTNPVPTPPTTGNYVLKCTDGVMSWEVVQ